MEKTVEERLKECLQIAKGLEEVGITKEFRGRKELDERIQDYIKTGDPWAGTIEFPELNRIADVILARRKHIHCSLNLRFVPYSQNIQIKK
jgi:hypothetical protein